MTEEHRRSGAWKKPAVIMSGVIVVLALLLAAFGPELGGGTKRAGAAPQAQAVETSVEIVLNVLPSVEAWLTGAGLRDSTGIGGEGLVFRVLLNTPRALTAAEMNTLETRIKNDTSLTPLISQRAR